LIVSFIKKYCGGDITTITRCLNKATFIYFDNAMCLVMDEEYIYYIGGKVTSPLDIGIKLSPFRGLMNNKLFYTKKPELFGRYIEEVSDKEGPNGRLYRCKVLKNY